MFCYVFNFMNPLGTDFFGADSSPSLEDLQPTTDEGAGNPLLD